MHLPDGLGLVPFEPLNPKGRIHWPPIGHLDDRVHFEGPALFLPTLDESYLASRLYGKSKGAEGNLLVELRLVLPSSRLHRRLLPRHDDETPNTGCSAAAFGCARRGPAETR